MSLTYSHVLVGAGSVGLAIAGRLARAGHRCLLVEKNAEVGSETSSRNSEVIHAGLYYPPDSLKAKLCIRGKELIYQTKELQPYLKRCGKWLVAQTPDEARYFEKLLRISENTGVPLRFLSLSEAKQVEPCVIAKEAILESPTTGIISSHMLMAYYEAQLTSDYGEGSADLSLLTQVTDIAKIGDKYQLQCMCQGEEILVTTARVINSAGLWAPRIARMVGLDYPDLFAKGNYFSYNSPRPKVGRLIYPCPADNGSLGTHLTVDLNGALKFGPDFEWVDSPTDYSVNSGNLEAAKAAIQRYIEIDPTKLTPSYSGIRPKLTRDTGSFSDFHIAEELPGFYNLLGIESPGLTSSMAIAEHINDMQ